MSINATNFYTFDERGNVAQRTNAGGGPHGSDLYDGYGRSRNGSPGDVWGFGAQWGDYTDSETGLVLMTHRFYDPQTGRFLTRDPMGYEGGVNLYSYTGNNPINEIDPDGTIAGGLPLQIRRPLPQQHNFWEWLHDFDQSIGLDSTDPGLPQPPCGCSQSSSQNPPIKRGPKPKGTGPHNAKIAERIEQLKKEHSDWNHEGGGDITEETVLTPGGFKSSRRPDITFRKPDGTLYRENVGKTFKDGSPILREKRALDDLERQTGTRPSFTPYDR